MLGSQTSASLLLGLASIALVVYADEQKEFGSSGYEVDGQELYPNEMARPIQFFDDYSRFVKRGDIDGSMPGVLRFGKRAQSFIRFGRSDGDNSMEKRDARSLFMQKKEMPGVLRFGKRSQQEKKSMPGVLRFGKRSDMPGMLRFGKRDEIPGVLRFGKKSVPGVLRFGRK
ncbi:unnamed protein product, partial [Mesorhabditis spiculigera]